MNILGTKVIVATWAMWFVVGGITLWMTFTFTDSAYASHTTGTYAIFSPLALTQPVTSPSRFHTNGSSCPVSLYDATEFDDTSYCVSAVGTGNWSIDVDATSGDDVYVDVEPYSFNGYTAGGQYRVVAGGMGDFRPGQTCADDAYQYFGLHVWNSLTSMWENYGWIVLGHINRNTVRFTEGQIVISSRTTRGTTVVADVASSDCWGDHVHAEFYNYTMVSRSYDWDGPTNNDDSTLGPYCTRSGPQIDNECNAQVLGSDRIGWIGGYDAWSEYGNPYYQGF